MVDDIKTRKVVWAFYLSQYVHLNGFSPLCVLLWMVKAPVMAKDFPHPG
jgi:hypothetical protein